MLAHRIVLVEYFATDDVTLLFGVRVDWDEPKVAEIKRTLSDIRNYVTRHFSREAAKQRLPQRIRAFDLDEWQTQFGALVEPIKEWAEPSDYVYLVPHGPLHYLPLHALKLDGQYLIERHPVLYTPSASVLKYCRAKRKGRRDRALVLGDSNGDLVHARAEAIAIANAFGVQAHLGPAARKSLVRAKLEQEKEVIDVLHFACHGHFYDNAPLKSGILMASEENGAEPSEHELKPAESPTSRYLTAEEWLGMGMQADLVTLSACESGVSDIRPGDELFGLMRALIYAGTPSVVMSLWLVEDISNSILMQKFYQALKQPGITKVEALQTAQLALQKMTAREVIDYCQVAIRLLQDAGEAAAFHSLTKDIANLHYQAGDYAEAHKIYTELLKEAEKDEPDPKADSERKKDLVVALARCEAAGPTQNPDYEKRVFSHPFHWAPFILVGDWQ